MSTLSSSGAARRPAEPATFVFCLVDGHDALTVCAAIEVLRLANRALDRAAFDWRLVSEDGQPVLSSSGTRMAIAGAIEDERGLLRAGGAPHMALICADEQAETYSSRSVETWLRECRRHRVALGGLGRAAHVLARAGLLAGRRCTLHWNDLPAFGEHFPLCLPQSTLFEVDDDIWTCAGGAACFDMMLHLVGNRHGTETVEAICAQALVERVRQSEEPQRLPSHNSRTISNIRVIKVVEAMRRHLSEPLPIEQLAIQVRLSRRQLERLFREELGRSPVRYYREMRLEWSRLLLSKSDMPVVEIAIATGFQSASHFSRCFREAYGETPQEARINLRARHRISPEFRVAA